MAGCRARMRGNDHEAQRRYQGGWPLSGECEQNARLFCERCSTRRSGTPPAERRPPPDGGRPALRAPLPRRRRCRPLRRLRRRMPGLFGSLWQHTRDLSATRESLACRSVARASVHPRLGGAAKLKRSVSRSVTGSSPPARGRPWERSGAKADFGFIPACAGEPAVGSLPAGLAGPSPRVRGSRGVGRLRDDERGSIPACAGEPARRWRPTGGRRVHPRVRGPDLAGVCHVRPLTRFIPACGAAGSVRGSVDCRLGSSPRARGWQSRFGVSRATERFIPACAGPP